MIPWRVPLRLRARKRKPVLRPHCNEETAQTGLQAWSPMLGNGLLVSLNFNTCVDAFLDHDGSNCEDDFLLGCNSGRLIPQLQLVFLLNAQQRLWATVCCSPWLEAFLQEHTDDS